MKKNQKTNQNKVGALILTLILFAYIAPLSLAYAGGDEVSGQGEPAGTGKFPEVPGVPDNAVQYNKTETTPVAEMEQVASGEPTLFQYKNMTMLINSSQNCEVVFTADPDVTPKIFGLNVEPNQTMTLTMNLSRSPLQGEMVQERFLNFYLGIEPNATLQLRAQIRLHINQTELSRELNREINASRLTWMYWNRTRAEWEPVESHMDQNGYLVCNTDHFSTWTVGEIDPAEESFQFYLNQIYIYIGIFVVVAVVATVGIVVLWKRR